jgi:hypothetical protein
LEKEYFVGGVEKELLVGGVDKINIVVVVKQHMPQGGLNGGRLYTGGSGRGQAR